MKEKEEGLAREENHQKNGCGFEFGDDRWESGLLVGMNA